MTVERSTCLLPFELRSTTTMGTSRHRAHDIWPTLEGSEVVWSWAGLPFGAGMKSEAPLPSGVAAVAIPEVPTARAMAKARIDGRIFIGVIILLFHFLGY